VRLGNERTGRTARYTLTAVDATRRIHPFVKGGSDSCFGTPIDEVNASNSLYFVADTDTFSAFDTFFGISDDGFTGRIDRISVTLSDEPPFADAERFGKQPKLAISIPFAKEAIVGMIGEEQFDNGSSSIDDPVSLGVNFHSGGNGKGTGRNEASLSFDFDDADAAGTCG
jgi:hypothetical protein